MKHIRTPESRCPECRYKVNTATCVSREAASPKPGDLSVCMNCGAVSIFTDGLTLRPSTLAERSGPDVPEALEIMVRHVLARGRLHDD